MNSIDVHIGRVLRSKRTAIPLTLSEVASLVAIADDEVMRIEIGRQRASATRLMRLCRLYATSPAELFRDLFITPDEMPIAEAAQ